MKHWEAIFKHSFMARLLWCEQTGMAIKSYSPTRWWSRWECAKQVMELWGDVLPFLRNNVKVAQKSREKLVTLLSNNLEQLLVELAVVIDAGEPFVRGTYVL